MTEKVTKEKLKKLIEELGSIRGRHTELVRVYVPKGYSLHEISSQLQQEAGTAQNIKSKAVMKNVVSALEKIVQHIKLLKSTPENGLVLFCGNVSETEGRTDLQIWAFEPPEELNTKLYWCDQKFDMEPLEDMVEEKELYGMLVFDSKEATFAILKGKKINIIESLDSIVPGKTKAGGQCNNPDTLLQLDNGEILKIKDVEEFSAPKSANLSKLSVEKSVISDKWYAEKNETFKIVTKNPRMINECSADHGFFVRTSEGIIEKKAKNLTKNDILIMPEKINIKGKQQLIFSKKYYNSFSINKDGQRLLKSKRKEKELLQKELADLCKLQQMTISHAESGNRNLMRNTLQRICNELDINHKQFLRKYTDPYKFRNIVLPDEIDENFAQFIGYYLGDGSSEKDRITLFEQRKEVANKYKKKYDKYFGTNSSYKFRKDKNYHQLKFTSRPLVRLMKEEFPELNKSLDSEVPKKILRSPNNIIAAFLKGFFDADGYVSENKGIGLGINNKILAQQVQLLLLRFSIISSLNEYDNRRNPYSDNIRYTISIDEKQSQILFNELIGFTSDEKRKISEKNVENKSDRNYTRQIFSPGTTVRKMIEENGYKKEDYKEVSNFFYDKSAMSKNTFDKVILNNSKIKNNELYRSMKEIYDCPLLPVKISNIERRKEKSKMVDISTSHKNFFANGILVHNSSARYGRVRDGMLHDFLKKIAERFIQVFDDEKIKGIIVGGPGPLKEIWVEGDLIPEHMKEKILGVRNVGYTNEVGIEELLQNVDDILAESETIKEKKLLQKFFDEVYKKNGKAVYGLEKVQKAIEMGAADLVIVSDKCPIIEIEHMNDSGKGEIKFIDKKDKIDYKIVGERDLFDYFEEAVESIGAEVKMVSVDTKEGETFQALGGIGALLRFVF